MIYVFPRVEENTIYYISMTKIGAKGFEELAEFNPDTFQLQVNMVIL